MNQVDLEQFIKNSVLHNPDNLISAEYALSEDLVGIAMYDEPLIGYAHAQDALFEEIANHERFYPLYKKPCEWLPSAQTVISIFFPYSMEVKISNRNHPEPSALCLHSRIEGQKMIGKITQALVHYLVENSHQAVAPLLDERFMALNAPHKLNEKQKQYAPLVFTLNWSERHCAYVAGLGTFSLSKGIITAKGMAGRLTSVITDCRIAPTVRNYTSYDEYCIKCGACIPKCPVQAISMEQGKNHDICSEYLDQMLEKYKPRYGCGKCQLAVPCEGANPRTR